MKEVYLDHAATTPVLPCVAALAQELFTEAYGNPSSKHKKGLEAEQYLKAAGETLAGLMKVTPKELIFTSGGTEANNLALIGAALANQRAGKHLITTAFEHASVYQPLLFLEELGFRVTFLPVDAFGQVSPEALADAICDDTLLVSIMMVNNEIGAVQDIAALTAAARAKKPELLFHVDAIQAFGKYTLYPKRLGVDLLSVSGHKLHAPKGSGLLYVRDKVKLKPLLHGGGQQRGLRSGTENVAAIAGLARAAQEYAAERETAVAQMTACKRLLVNGLRAMEGVTVHALGDGEEALLQTAPHIVSAGFAGIKSEVLLHALAEEGIYVSSGSACSSNHPGISGTLKAIGVRQELLDATLRFSFSRFTTEAEIETTLDALRRLLPKLRRFYRH